MWKWIAISSLMVLALQAGFTARQTAVAKDQSLDFSVPRKIAEAAMERIKERDLHAALAILGEADSKNHSAESVAAQVEAGARQIAKQLAILEGLGANLHEIEFVGSDAVGKSYVTFNYLERFERRGLVWKITFYRSKESWILANLEWTQDLRSYFRPTATESTQSLSQN